MFIINVIFHPLLWKYTYKISDIIDHHGSSTYVKRNCYSYYISYINIMFICKQVYNVNLHGFNIKDYKENMFLDDTSMLKVLSMHEQEEKEEKIIF